MKIIYVVGCLLLTQFLTTCASPTALSVTPTAMPLRENTPTTIDQDSLTTQTGFYWPTGSNKMLFNLPKGSWLTDGCTKDGLYFSNKIHVGWDIAANLGDPVYPVADGIVYLVYTSADSLGTTGSLANQAVIVEHYLRDGTRFYGVYGHVQANVKKGDLLTGADHKPLGTVGSWQYGNHLHFGISPIRIDLNHLGTLDCKTYQERVKIGDTDGYVDPIAWINTNWPGKIPGESIQLPTETPASPTDTPRKTVPASTPTTAATLPSSTSGTLAFIKNFNVWLINADGSGQQQITFDGAWGPSRYRHFPDISYSNLSWSPDGKYLVFNRETQEKDSSIHLVNIESIQSNIILTNVQGGYDWTPDSQKIVFANSAYTDNSPGGLSTYDIQTGEIRILVAAKENSRLMNPEVSRDGEKVIYQIQPLDRATNPASSLSVGITDLGSGTNTVISGALECTVSPDSSQLVCAQGKFRNSCHSLELYSIIGSLVRVLPNPDSGCSYISGLKWSPAGSKIVLQQSDLITGTAQLYVLDLNRNETLKISGNYPYYGGAVWSSDGSYLAFGSRGDQKQTVISTIRVDGEQLSTVVEIQEDSQRSFVSGAAWRPRFAPTLDITPQPTDMVQLNKNDWKSVLDYLLFILRNNHPELIDQITGENGTALGKRYGTEYYLPGRNNVEEVKRELVKALTNASPSCVGYQKGLDPKFSTLQVYVQGLSCRDVGFCDYEPGQNLFYFLLTQSNQGPWELYVIGPVYKNLRSLITGLIPCP